MDSTGSITIKHGPLFYSLHLSQNGWLAADLVQYLDEILEAEDREIAILKLLGYTMEIGPGKPLRRASHWVEIDLESRLLATNSRLIRKAVDQVEAGPEDPCGPEVFRRIHRILDGHDFTVELVS